MIGLAGRASSQAWDLRAQARPAPYDVLEVRMKTIRTATSPRARRALRRDFRIAAPDPRRAERFAPGRSQAAAGGRRQGRAGLGRGLARRPVVALEAGEDGRIRSCHAHDPSWQNWPALAFAVFNNIVPDFPLINKSFNLSYFGCDL